MRFPTFLLVLIFAAGCTASKEGTKSKPSAARGKSSKTVVMIPSDMAHGKVAFVNDVARFAVLHYVVGKLPANDQKLNVYRNGQKVGELKVSGPQKDNNTVADIMAGEIKAGDEVRPD